VVSIVHSKCHGGVMLGIHKISVEFEHLADTEAFCAALYQC